jgi:hypothetical protein
MQLGLAHTGITVPFGSFAHEQIAPAEKQHEVFRPSFEKDLVQPFLGFPDVLGDYTGAVDLMQVKLLLIRCSLCRDGLVEEVIGCAAFWLTR